MIFDNSLSTFESEKERNLYYKIFAGYLLNEFIPGYQDRLQSLCSLINNSEERGKAAPKSTLKLDPTNTHISFDNHIYLFSPNLDRGEFADILIHDELNNTIVTIEAKLHSNWSYDKDILSNKRRLDLIQNNLPQIHLFPVLLVSRCRWENAKKMESHQNSHYVRFRDAPDCPFIVILWEQLNNTIENPDVHQFLVSQLDRCSKGFSYGFIGNWFKQTPRKHSHD
jgi:hypothetical protein